MSPQKRCGCRRPAIIDGTRREAERGGFQDRTGLPATSALLLRPDGHIFVRFDELPTAEELQVLLDAMGG